MPPIHCPSSDAAFALSNRASACRASHGSTRLRLALAWSVHRPSLPICFFAHLVDEIFPECISYFPQCLRGVTRPEPRWYLGFFRLLLECFSHPFNHSFSLFFATRSTACVIRCLVLRACGLIKCRSHRSECSEHSSSSFASKNSVSSSNTGASQSICAYSCSARSSSLLIPGHDIPP